MTKRIITIIFSLLLIPAISNSQTIKYEGKDFFINGANIPWGSFGNDVGYGYNASWFENIFTQAEKSGMNCLRFWIHCDGRGTPIFTSDGSVWGIDSYFFSSFDDIFERAKKHHIMIIPCLWSFDMTNANHASLIQDSVKTKSYINNVLIPMTKRYANQCNLLAWEIINEPEWSMRVTDGAKTTQLVTTKEMQRFVGMMAAAIHRNSTKMVTVGSAALKYNSTGPNCVANLWSDLALQSAAKDTLAFLDFYQIHYYNWMYPKYDPFNLQEPISYWNVDKPVIVGENPGKDLRYPPFTMLENAYKNKFAGVMFWSMAAYDGVSILSDFNTSLSDFRINHFDSVAFSCDPTEILKKDSLFLIATNNISLGVDSNSISPLAVSSNIPWKITNNVSWLKIVPDTSNGSDTILFKTQSTNDSTFARIDTVWIKAAGKPSEMIIVTQQKPIFSVYPRNFSLAAKAYSSSSFTITTNVSWKISGIDTSWLNVYPDSGFGSTQIRIISISKNETGNTRSATLTVTNPFLPSVNILINQIVSSGIITDNNATIISPNPTKGLFKLVIGDCYLDIMSTSGQVVFSSETKENKTIDLTNLDNGIYFIKAQNSNKLYLQKLIILK
jgi:hypothetical protein